MPTTQVGSHTVYYDDCGTGHPLLLLTGLGSTRMGWWKQVDGLSRKYRVINMDNRDAGESAPATAPYTIADMAGDAAGVIRNLGLAPAHVMGISMGGMIAQELAIGYPELVDKLILVSTSAGGPAAAPASPEIQALLMRDPNQDAETRIRRTNTLITAPGYMQAHSEDLDLIVKFQLARPMNFEGYMRQLGACGVHMAGGTADRLNQIQSPTLVIHGEGDPLVPYPNGQFLARHIPGAEFMTLPETGHLATIEAADRLTARVLEFLS